MEWRAQLIAKRSAGEQLRLRDVESISSGGTRDAPSSSLELIPSAGSSAEMRTSLKRSAIHEMSEEVLEPTTWIEMARFSRRYRIRVTPAMRAGSPSGATRTLP